MALPGPLGLNQFFIDKDAHRFRINPKDLCDGAATDRAAAREGSVNGCPHIFQGRSDPRERRLAPPACGVREVGEDKALSARCGRRHVAYDPPYPLLWRAELFGFCFEVDEHRLNLTRYHGREHINDSEVALFGFTCARHCAMRVADIAGGELTIGTVKTAT